MARTKSDWKVKLEELKKDLPKGFDARKFKGCRIDGKLDASEVGAKCKELNCAGKESAIISFLEHVAEKMKSKGKSAGKSKEKGSVVDEKELLSKRHYRSLSSSKIKKLIELLTGIEKGRREKDISSLKAAKQQIEKQIKELQGS